MDALQIALYSIVGLLLSKNLMHFFQLDSYQFPSFFKTLNRNVKHSYLPYLLLWPLDLLFHFRLIAIENPLLFYICKSAVLLGAAFLMHRKYAIRFAKKPLVRTARLKRLFVAYIVVLFLFVLIFARLNMLWIVIVAYIPVFFAAALLVWPVEKLISELYFRDARRKLDSMRGLTKVAITGSYGKTSVKNIIGHILNAYTPTLISPRSFNTPMGLTITIRNQLSPDYRVFVAEMGSRHLGDINELCRLVHPKIGVISSVGPQHLDTFKSLENVKKGKYELIQNLPQDGHAFFQDDQSIVRDMYQQTTLAKTLVSLYDEAADIYVFDIHVDSRGSRFKIRFQDEDELDCATVLLGEHNIKNIALSAAVCRYLGMPSELICRMISSIEAIKNRMEIINAGRYTIINDAFNSNPVGSKEAVNVLAKFPSRKIIITPGMVELGKDESTLNEAFGKHIGEHVDIAILIGKKRTEPIKRGILSAQFPAERLYVVSDLKESTTLLNSIVQDGDVVLYENDLPDNYIDA